MANRVACKSASTLKKLINALGDVCKSASTLKKLFNALKFM